MWCPRQPIILNINIHYTTVYFALANFFYLLPCNLLFATWRMLLAAFLLAGIPFVVCWLAVLRMPLAGFILAIYRLVAFLLATYCITSCCYRLISCGLALAALLCRLQFIAWRVLPVLPMATLPLAAYGKQQAAYGNTDSERRLTRGKMTSSKLSTTNMPAAVLKTQQVASS